MRLRLSARHIFIRVLCALSLALLAFGHQPLQLPRTNTLAIAAHAFPDGTVPVICLTDAAGKGDQKQAHRNDCDSCRVSSSFFLAAPECPTSADSIAAEIRPQLPAPPLLARAAYPPSAPPQAPPLPA